jgi:hypothetical protein
MKCLCDDGYELDKTGKKCVEITSCNKNNQCEPERYENCLNCIDCACEATKSFCDGAPIYPSVTDERGCRDCKGYCQLKYDDQHMDGRKKNPDYMCECNCELGYDLTEDGHCKEAKKKAYIFLSYNLSWRQVLFGNAKMDHIKSFYESKGYEVHMYRVKDAGEMLNVLKAKPEIGAIAYFGHEAGLAGPNIGAMNATSLKSKMNNALTYEYNERGMTLDDARAKANDKLKDGFGLDYAYIHACHSFDDNSLAETLVKKGGTFWGGVGVINPASTLPEYKRQ